MANDIATLLTENGEISAEQAQIIETYTKSFDNEEEGQGELGTLIKTHRPGEAAIIRSRRVQNVLVKWRDLLTKGVPAMIGIPATIPALLAAPLPGVIFCVVACLNALNVLVDTATIELGDAHAEVVLALWIQKDKASIVTLDELQHLVEGKIEPGVLETVLDDLVILGAIEFEDAKKIRKREKLLLK